MKFELEFFEEFIKKECKNSKGKSPQTEIPDYTTKCTAIEEEVERIKKIFRNHLFQTTDESMLERYVQLHQAFIIKLANKVASSLDKSHHNFADITPGHTQLNLCKVLLDAFEDLLTFIETHCSKYFDLDQQISDAYAFVSVKEIEEDYTNLKAMLSEMEVDNNMTRIILFPIHQFVTNEEKQAITFRRLIFLKYLVKDIQRLSRDFPKEELEQRLYEHMFYLNFNNHYFLQYTTSKITEETQEFSTTKEQLESLSLKLRDLSQAQVKPSFGLKPNRDSLRDQLARWINAEVQLIEKKHQLSLMIPPASQAEEPAVAYKIKTSLSVPQLAYSIKLLQDSGMITNTNKTKLIRFFSTHFSTSNNTNISAKSLTNKFFSVERSTISNVIDILINLQKIAEKEVY